MAKANTDVIRVIRATAEHIEQSNDYQWGHMGSCNCGFLAQEITQLRRDEIHAMAMQRYGNWNDQLNDYCPTSGMLMDDLISEMLQFGFDSDDLCHLERLSDGEVLRTLPETLRDVQHNKKDDVVLYLRAWADLLEQRLLEKISLPDFNHVEFPAL